MRGKITRKRVVFFKGSVQHAAWGAPSYDQKEGKKRQTAETKVHRGTGKALDPAGISKGEVALLAEKQQGWQGGHNHELS